MISGSFFSPRAALTYKAADNQSLRFTFNRSFNTPANFSFFLDLPATLDVGSFSRNASLRPFNVRTYDAIATGIGRRSACALTGAVRRTAALAACACGRHT